MNESFSKKIPSIIISLAVIGSVFSIGYYAGNNNDQSANASTYLENMETDKPESVDFSPFWKAWNILNEKYVPTSTSTPQALSDQEKIWGAIEGLASSLKDPYTVFMPPEEAENFQNEISGNFEGVGMEVGIKDETITVIAPLKGTPAERAGIMPGDKILKINETLTSGMKVEEAVKNIRGKRGTAVSLTIVREGKSEPLEIKIVRDVITIPTVETEIKPGKISAGGEGGAGLQENGVFVIKLYSFSAPSANLFRESLRKFIESGSTRLLVDLRGNPGGYLESAVDMASWFLPAGKTVVTEDFGKNGEERVHRSVGYDVFNQNLKMAVLVNGGSASASEILAGALQDYGIAKLVGTQTFGKGSVQELVRITPDTSLKVTIARWLTPKGNSISSVGLKPDYEVKMTPDDITKGKDPQMEKAIQILTD